MKKSDVIAGLLALAHETRLDIFRMLIEAGPKGIAAGRIAERLGVSPTSVSFHLNQLRHADLISFRRESRSLIYTAAYPVMTDLVNYLTQNCCRGSEASCKLNEFSSLLCEQEDGATQNVKPNIK